MVKTEVKKTVICLDIWFRTPATPAETMAVSLLWQVVFGPRARHMGSTRVSPTSYKYRGGDGERLERLAEVLKGRSWDAREFVKHRHSEEVETALSHMQENGTPFDDAIRSARSKMTHIMIGTYDG